MNFQKILDLAAQKKRELTKEEKRFDFLLEEYEKQFGEALSTECFSLSIAEFIQLLEECLAAGKTYEELTGDYFDDDADY